MVSVAVGRLNFSSSTSNVELNGGSQSTSARSARSERVSARTHVSTRTRVSARTNVEFAFKQASEEADEDDENDRRVSSASRNSFVLDGSTTFAQKLPSMASFVVSKPFDLMMSVVISLNCATMGIEAQSMLSGSSDTTKVLITVGEHFFTAIFALELLLRLAACGVRSYLPVVGSTWNFVDGMLVIVTGVGFVWVMPLFTTTEGGGIVRTLTILRAFRLVRVVRVVRDVELFHEVWLLLRGLSDSFRTLLWTLVVVFFVTYIFAVFGVMLISVEISDEYEGAHDESTKLDLQKLKEYTHGLDLMMLTLIQVLTLDSWNNISRPIQNYIGWAWIFFFLYIAVAVFVLMNLVTAIIVDNALCQSRKDEEQQALHRSREHTKGLRKFQRLFELLDADGDGFVSLEEFQDAFNHHEVRTQLQVLNIEEKDLGQLFHLLDTGDGALDIHEFWLGLQSMKGDAKAKEVFRIQKSLDGLVRLFAFYVQAVGQDLAAIFNVMGIKEDKVSLRVSKFASTMENSALAGRKSHVLSVINGMTDSGLSETKQGDANTEQNSSSGVKAAATTGIAGDTSHSGQVSGPGDFNLSRRVDSLVKDVETLGHEVNRQVEGLSGKLVGVKDSVAALAESVEKLARDQRSLMAQQAAVQTRVSVEPQIVHGSGREAPGCNFICRGGSPVLENPIPRRNADLRLPRAPQHFKGDLATDLGLLDSN